MDLLHQNQTTNLLYNNTIRITRQPQTKLSIQINNTFSTRLAVSQLEHYTMTQPPQAVVFGCGAADLTGVPGDRNVEFGENVLALISTRSDFDSDNTEAASMFSMLFASLGSMKALNKGVKCFVDAVIDRMVISFSFPRVS